MDNCLKAVAESPYELVVENKIIVFGGRDAAGFVPVAQADGTLGYAKSPNADGSLGEKFSKETELESQYTKTGKLLVDFEHGRDPDKIGNNKNEILGYVDWKTATITDEGVIVKRVLNRRHKYMKWLEPLIRAGLVGNSSEAIAGKPQKTNDGTIIKWPLKRDTLTVNPMETRMLTNNVIIALKSLAIEFPEYKSLIPSDAALTDEDENNNQSKQLEPAKAGKDKKMDEKEMQDIITAASAKAVADALAVRDAQAKAEAEKAAHEKALFDEAYKKGVEDAVKSRKAPNYNRRPKDTPENENNGVAAFKHWMGTGQENDELIRPNEEFLKAQGAHYIGEEGKAAWNVTTGGSGAFLVPDPLYNQIVPKRDLASWVRQAPVQHFTTPADHLLVPRESTKHTAFVLTAEAGPYDENEGTVSQKDLIIYKYTKMTKVNEEFLMYQGTNWESWFANAMARAEAVTENTIFTTGTGTGQPEGVLVGATVANTSATTDIILPSELTALIGYLGGGYNVSSECGLLMRNATKWYLKGSGGTSVVPFAYLNTPQGGDFFGYPAWVSDDMEDYTTGSAKSIVFGNFTYYGVVEKPGMMIQRNPYLYMATGQVGIFCSIFRGGGVLQSEAFYYFTNHS